MISTKKNQPQNLAKLSHIAGRCKLCCWQHARPKLTHSPTNNCMRHNFSTALTRFIKREWADRGADARDPRTAPGTQVTMCTHATWVHPMAHDDALGRALPPAYMQLSLPFWVLQCLARLRIGAAQLEVQLGRQARPRVARRQRVCRLCSCTTSDMASRPIWRARIHARTGTHDIVEDL
jgi:hypothetical protein